MSNLNPLGLLVNYGDSDEDIDEESPLPAKYNDYSGKTPSVYPGYEASYQNPSITAGIQPSPIAHCPWSACYDENSGFTYYWNQQTNAVTWEAPPEYMLALKLAQQQLHAAGSAEVSAEEWQLYQQALAEKQNSQNKLIAKNTVNTVKKQEKTLKQKKADAKALKKRPASDDEEKIELITSYHNSDSESNDESEKSPPIIPPLPKPPNKLPKHPQKKQKTKPQVEFGPPLPPNQNYTVPIGPELPTEALKECKPNLPEDKVDITNKQDVVRTSKPKDEDGHDEMCLLKELKDKAKLLEKLGGELPSDLQKIIKDDMKSINTSPRGGSNIAEDDIDDMLQEIEKTELPKVNSKEKNDEKQSSNVNSTTNSPKSGTRTPVETCYPSTNGAISTLFPSAANIEEPKPETKPEIPAIVEKEKKENVYLTNLDTPIENVGRKKLRISNSVLPERKREKSEVPAYTTKYSQFIEGFSNERTGLGFTKDEDVANSPKNMINYGNGLTFTKGETLNEEKKDEDLDDLTDLVEAKLKFLNQLQPCVLSPLQEMLIQMQTLVSAFRAGALSGAYWRRWARGAEAALGAHEAAAAPPGWLCVFQRSEGRYCYRRESDGFVQYEYPAVASTDMDICTTPPHPSSEPKQEAPPPPPSPPRSWRSTPPPPGTDPAPLEPPPQPRTQEPKKEIGDELQSFYNDIAELEKTSGPTEPNSPEPPPPPEISDKWKEKDNKVVKKKPKMKVSASLSMKNKSVSSLVAKWQQVADEINSD